VAGRDGVLGGYERAGRIFPRYVRLACTVPRVLKVIAGLWSLDDCVALEVNDWFLLEQLLRSNVCETGVRD
jgi:hypothetical protein